MNNRIYFFYGVLLIGFMLLLGRAFELQIIFGTRNREIAEGNRIRKIVNPAPRGMIYDRKDRPLVRNVPVYRRCAPECRQISRDESLRIEVRGGQEAEELRVDIGREYVYGPALAHLLGYLGELNEEEVKAGKGNLGDLSGRTGIEEKYNDILKGTDGGEVFEVNAEGVKVREIGVQQPVSGKDLYLSVDAELSKVAFEALQGRAGRPGAVVATEAKTGAVLVLVSSPSFNPGKITEKVLTDKSRPMFNRAVGGLYPPGSVFKIVTATAGLEERKIDANTLYEDPGEIRVGDYVYKNWYFTQYGKTEGKINIVRAIRRSTDTFFYKVGEWIGASRLAEWAKAFGLGRRTGIDLPTEAEGLVPDPSSGPWFLGNTYHFAIGQQDLLTTPLQVNIMTSIIANDGKLCQPTIAQDTSVNCQNLQLKPETLRLVQEGMKEACSSGGTAFPFFDFEPQVACKTGTAEFGDPQNRTHAWLTAFAPADDPQIVVTALVEAGGEGSYIAAPIVKKVMEAWF